MLQKRIIPSLLLTEDGLVKTVKFSNPTYIGDPINAVKIYNEKEVDELVILDIEATKKGNKPRFDLIEEIATECFMPFAYAGGVTEVDDVRKLLKLGVEKVIITSEALNNPQLIKEAVDIFGSSTIVVGIDITQNMWGNPRIYSHASNKKVKVDLDEHIKEIASYNPGELLLNFVYKDGTMGGFDIDVVNRLTKDLDIPVVVAGGAGSIEDIKELFEKTSVNAAACGSIFVYHGETKGILINYPKRSIIEPIISL